MAPTARLPPKKDVALALLEQASMYIHLDPRAEEVQVPSWFKKQPQLVLQVGLNMPVPIKDLHVDERGISCTLSFNRSPFFCMIPWPAVFALVGENGQAMVWAEDVPAEVSAQAQAQKEQPKPRTHLRSVGEGESAPPPAAKAEPAKPAEKKPTAKAAAKRTVKGATKSKDEAKAVPKATAKASPKPTAKPAEAKPHAKKPQAAPQPEPALAPATAKSPAQSKPEASRATTEIAKPKRELPPYLRVVK